MSAGILGKVFSWKNAGEEFTIPPVGNFHLRTAPGVRVLVSVIA